MTIHTYIKVTWTHSPRNIMGTFISDQLELMSWIEFTSRKYTPTIGFHGLDFIADEEYIIGLERCIDFLEF